MLIIFDTEFPSRKVFAQWLGNISHRDAELLIGPLCKTQSRRDGMVIEKMSCSESNPVGMIWGVQAMTPLRG
jgi:hypothetical protein